MRAVDLAGLMGASIGDCLYTPLPYITCTHAAFCSEVARLGNPEVLMIRVSPLSCGSMPPVQ